ncbi:enoyl-[acyl-carrier-protein] reductase FabL [Thermoanaerobaculum aquaticum]|uniref:enoyl-[acyl-carrier-protein] reductase FabL n=1 Tax=Thermoanaerobaculum aquaticum TaxID=1312852 RepID=UPI00056E31BE|nr:enoyl-[acyl-carrier-protein] reductase FabL [Thermoanaerobaculum aquaticum]BCW92605.1 MAG: enoyl-[acyl-carrier-protein] reductase [Thermoanaerobaculum sp.]GBC79141.1 Enoyl-[acyl-carrier-protein] reductase [NADPH] FabL [bacterium HR09]
MDLRLRGKRALVTGASRGIGRAIALSLADFKVDVAINFFRHRQPAEEVAKEIEARGARALLIKANVADEEHVERMFAEIREHWGGLEILVSNAASGVLKPATELTMHHLHWTMDINALALVPLVQHFLQLPSQGEKVVVAVSSLGAVRAIPNYTAVGASKAALESMVRHLACELAGKGVRVNAVSAGTVDTDALKHFPNREQLLEESRRRTPAGRLITPQDVANAVVFLCTEFASMIHGQTIVVDGGYSILA